MSVFMYICLQVFIHVFIYAKVIVDPPNKKKDEVK